MKEAGAPLCMDLPWFRGSSLSGDASHGHWQLEGRTHGVTYSTFITVPALPLLIGAWGM